MTACKTTCPYCGVGCGVLATPDGRGGVGIKGDETHPANEGRLCVKGTMLGDTVDLDGRLTQPKLHGRDVSWDVAIAETARQFAKVIRDHGPDSVALYVSGQLLTEDYYVANKLMKGFIGSANIDTNSRLCMASSVAGHKRAFGADVVPGCYDDFEEADAIVLVGSNLAWCHPVLHQRIAAVKKARPALRIVNIDPRRTATSEFADIHLGVKPGADVALFNGLLSYLSATGRGNHSYITNYVDCARATLEAAGPFDLKAAADATGIDQAELMQFYELWAGTERVVTIYSQGVNQWSSGTDKVNSILNCHLYTGRIGKPGAGPFSVTGQPNAMGGREVGGLANMLAAHMDLGDAADRARVQRFWGSPRMATRPGLKAVDLFHALERGDIKALWVMATNPAVSLPEADRVRAALARSDRFLVVSDIMAATDTTHGADLLLPATGWGEKDGTVTNSERMISRQRPFLPAPGAARHDWRIMSDVAKALGRELGEDWDAAFAYKAPADVFREHAALSGYENSGARAFDISAYETVSNQTYEAMPPFRWPLRKNTPIARTRFFADGGFYHPNGRARMAPVTPRATGEALTPERPFILNTGRVRDQWHTMTRTAKSAKLSQHIAEPYLEMNPEDAQALGIEDAALARIESAHGAMIARAQITDRQRRGSVFAPMHWTGATASLGRVDALAAPVVDPVSGQPETKRNAVSVAAWPARWYGFAVSAEEPDLDFGYWAKARTASGWRVEMADLAPLAEPDMLAQRLLNPTLNPAVALSAYQDPMRKRWRFAAFRGDEPVGVLFLAPEPVAAARDWLIRSVEQGGVDRFRLLAGRSGAATADEGPVVCVCHNVGAKKIARAIDAGAATVDAVGEACVAGTNCGSCRPEIATLIAARRAAPKVAAE
ncbi:MAG: molybdopterin-dependent oxidoreductase [Neomegalonema sp.]|nr:molybdopterin-dependent oxidoreductase [Neomegalonema sp.]